MNKELKRNLVLRRVPPGDRWEDANESSSVLESLTDALEYMFQKTGNREYHLSALDGKIYAVEEVEVAPPPITKYSLYGE